MHICEKSRHEVRRLFIYLKYLLKILNMLYFNPIEMLSYIQIVLAVILGALILIQHSEGSLGAAFGGGSMDSAQRTRRGPELWIFRGTIVIAILFVASTVINLLY
jgi:protein translocase SecG subunit